MTLFKKKKKETLKGSQEIAVLWSPENMGEDKIQSSQTLRAVYAALGTLVVPFM